MGNLAPLDTGGTFLDGLNRSFPIRYMVMGLRQNVSGTFSDLVTVLSSPFMVLIQKAEGIYNVDNILTVEERLVRPFLVWRGTPQAYATGFSIHVVPYSFLFYGFFGLTFFSSLIGCALGIGANLARLNGILPRILSAFLITFVLSSAESFVSSYTSLCYRLLFLILFVFFSALYPRTRQS